MKHEELIDFTQKILETNYLPVYRFTLPCENLEHLDQGLRYHILGVKNTCISLPVWVADTQQQME